MSSEKTVLICSCERTMPLDESAVRRGCAGARVEAGHNLCGLELDRVRARLAAGGEVLIGCTQEAPLFREVAEDLGFEGELGFANIRETAGWSVEADAAGPKMAALLTAAAEPMPAAALVSMASEGVTLIYGRDETAIEVGRRLADRLDVTVLIDRPDEVTPPRVRDFPVLKGTIRNAKGHLGAFELVVDDYAQPAPSSRTKLLFGPARDGAVSRADLIVDLSGGRPLFPAHELRDGYLRADPGSPAAVAEAVLKASDLVGTFDKPRYIAFHAALCAHSRSQITGCTRCLDLCPTGAIAPAGDHVAIDPHVCAGCGSCAAACPTGAAEYALPPADALLRRMRTLLLAYREAGGENAVVLLHDARHGDDLIDALSRFGEGLPANVLPVQVNETTELGLEGWTAPFLYGAAAARVLGPARPKHDLLGLSRNIETANVLLEGLGFGPGRCGLIATDDPDALGAALRAIPPGVPACRPITLLPMGAKRGLLESTLRALQTVAPAPVDAVGLPRGAPVGGLAIDVEGCTLCLSCVSACPSGALSDSPDRPTLRFTEQICVQCGLCAATCPEKVIELRPRMDFVAWGEPKRLVKEEEPFHCIACGKAFGTRSTVERIVAKLEGRHWMYAGANARRLDVIRMCEDCRVQAVMSDSLDPYAGAPERPKPRATEDYLAEREAKQG